jgi:hypothetical protein
MKTDPTDHDLILQSERLVAGLRGRGSGAFIAAVKQVLGYSSGTPLATPATKQLASIWWPLVLTTNYDRMFLDAFNEHHRLRDSESMVVVGRGRPDCRTVLATADVSMRPVLWALQGSFGPGYHRAQLQDEIVLGYDQYREATFNNPWFRATFTEIFRNRSLLFLGTGLSEEYFRGLFGESLTRLGPGHRSHFALVNEAQIGSSAVDPWFLHTRLNIVVLTYRDAAERYSGFVPCLQDIARSVSLNPDPGNRVRVATPFCAPWTIEVVAAKLPEPSNDHWVVVSAGLDHRTGRLRPSRCSGLGNLGYVYMKDVDGGDGVWRVKGKPILLAAARNSGIASTSGRSRDLRTVADVTRNALAAAIDAGCTSISMMMIAAGKTRRWPRVFSLIQMARGIRRLLSSSANRGREIHVVIHDTEADREPSVWNALHSGCLDLDEILSCEGIRCFVDVEDEMARGRTPIFLTGDERLRDIAHYFQLTPTEWLVRLEPQAFGEQPMIPATSDETLVDLGVVPGSTISFVPAA